MVVGSTVAAPSWWLQNHCWSVLHVQFGKRPHRTALCLTCTKTTYLSSRFCTWGKAERAIWFHPNSGTPLGEWTVRGRSWVTNPELLRVRTKAKTAGSPKVTNQWTIHWLAQLNLKLTWFESRLLFPAAFCHQRLTKSSSSDITHSVIWLIYLPPAISLLRRVTLSPLEDNSPNQWGWKRRLWGFFVVY